MKTVVRLTRHPADSDRINALVNAFGDDTVVYDEDIEYGADPVATVKELLSRYGAVVALEVIAPMPVLMKVVDAQRQLGNVVILRAQFKRDAGGRAVVSSKDEKGRDVLAFSHYEVIERIEFKTRPLEEK